MLNLKFALRTLFKTPFVTIVAIVSLALGIGANAAIFSLFNQMLLRPLPVPEPDRLVNLAVPGPKPGGSSCGQAGGCDNVFSYPMFRDLEKVQTVFTSLGAHVNFGANLSARGQTQNGEGLLVSGGYFQALGVKPAIGRLLGPEDDRTIGEAHVVVLSHAYWQSRFGLDPGVLNQTIIVNGQTMTIVGVAERGFDGTTLGLKPRLFAPITMRGFSQPFKGFDNRRSYWACVFARLKPGVDRPGQVALGAQYHTIVNDVEVPLQKGMSPQTLERFKAKPLLMVEGARGQSDVRSEAKAPLLLLFGVTAFVLIIACANIANLLLARSASLAAEMAVRLSIGAGRGQLIRQLLGESCLLALFGGAGGLLVAQWTLNLMASLLPSDAANTIDFSIDWRMMLFAAALALGTGMLFGLFPAVHSTRPDLVSALKGQSGQPSGARAASRSGRPRDDADRVVDGAARCGGALRPQPFNVSRVQLGLKADHVVMFSISPELNGYSPEKSLQLYERVEDELSALPGVSGVTSATVPLLGGSNWGNSVAVEGFNAGPDTDRDSRFNIIGPAYFQTLGMPLIAGREFTRADTMGAPKVVIVNEAFAKKFNLSRDAVVGKHIGDGGANEKLTMEIVGFVQNAKYSDVKREIPPQFFRPARQDERAGFITFYARVSTDPDQFLANIPKAIARLDANLPVENLKTLPNQIRENVFLDRFISVLSTAFASLATLLAAIGLYGVLAYTVTQRTREIGLRMALGADPGRVRRMVMRQVGLMTLAGGAIGLGAAVGLGQLAQSLLFQLKGSDPVVLMAAAGTLTAVSLAAGFIPAHRASQADPMTALRYE
jgi:predicted permease